MGTWGEMPVKKKKWTGKKQRKKRKENGQKKRPKLNQTEQHCAPGQKRKRVNRSLRRNTLRRGGRTEDSPKEVRSTSCFERITLITLIRHGKGQTTRIAKKTSLSPLREARCETTKGDRKTGGLERNAKTPNPDQRVSESAGRRRGNFFVRNIDFCSCHRRRPSFSPLIAYIHVDSSHQVQLQVLPLEN